MLVYKNYDACGSLDDEDDNNKLISIRRHDDGSGGWRDNQEVIRIGAVAHTVAPLQLHAASLILVLSRGARLA